MPEEKDKSKATVENQDEEDKNKKGDEEDQEDEDPFSDLFDEEEDEDKGDDEEDEEEEDEEEEKPKKKVSKKTPKQPRVNVDEIVSQRLQVAEQRLERRADVTEFLSSDKGKLFSENIKGFNEKIRQAAMSQKYMGVPVSKLPALILTEAAYDKALSDARKKADTEADDSSYVGGAAGRKTNVPDLKDVDPTTMSTEDFAKMKEDAKRGKYVIKRK